MARFDVFPSPGPHAKRLYLLVGRIPGIDG